MDYNLIGTVEVTEGLKPDGSALINAQKEIINLDEINASKIGCVDAAEIAIKHRLGSATSPIINTAIIGAFAGLTGLLKIESISESNIPKLKLNEGKIGLRTTNLNFAYDSIEIFSNLNLLIKKFRCLGIVGENGCGKSTLASLLLNVEKPNSGSIELISVNNNQNNIGFLDQFPERLIGINTIDEFVAKLIANNILNESQISIVVQDLEKLNIEWEKIYSIPGNRLSWTELRVALICILANCNYDALILDEPTFGMGQNQTNNLRSYLIRYLEKKHLILISHDNLFLESMCDATVEL